MAKNKRRVYGEDGGEDSPACPECGCRHMEVTRTAVGKTQTLVRRVCRYCGRDTVRTETDAQGD